MARKKVEVNDKTVKRIERWTGGLIRTHYVEEFGKKEGALRHSFVGKDGTYIGDYNRALWYLRHHLIVWNDHPNQVAIRMKAYNDDVLDKTSLKKDPEKWLTQQWKKDALIGLHGFTHRGGQTFALGDRLFDVEYEPKEEDYKPEDWKKFTEAQEEAVKRNLEDGYYVDEKEAYNNIPIKNVIPFNMRGATIITNWDEARQAALNVSNYLS